MVFLILIPFTPILLLIVKYHFSELTKILILPIKDILQGIMHYFIMPRLPTTGLETSVDAAVDRLNISVVQAINLAVPSGCVTKHKYSIWFSGRLRAYIKKKYFF
jgi:hypothetical protein